MAGADLLREVAFDCNRKGTGALLDVTKGCLMWTANAFWFLNSHVLAHGDSFLSVSNRVVYELL